MPVVIDEVVTEVTPATPAPAAPGAGAAAGSPDPRELLQAVARAERRRQRLEAN